MPHLPKDFSILYHSKDVMWARWIEFAFSSRGYSVELFDFSTGDIPNVFEWIYDCGSETEVALIIESEEILNSSKLVQDWGARVLDSPLIRQIVMLRRQGLEAPILQATFNKSIIGLARNEFEGTLVDILGRLSFKMMNRKFASENNTVEEPIYPGSLPRNWMMPYDPPTSFTGRRDELRLIQDNFGMHHALAVYANDGGRGNGLSSLVARAIYDNVNEFSSVWWVYADNPSLMLADIKELGKRFKVATPSNNFAEVWAAVCAGIAHRAAKPFLVVLDHPSAETMHEFENLYAQKWTGGMLMVVGAKPSRSDINQIAVDGLPAGDSVWILGLSSTDASSEEDQVNVGPLESLAKFMRNKPLLLAMAGQLLKNGKRIERFIQDFNIEGQLISSLDPELRPYMINVRFILDQLALVNPDAERLLIFSAYFCARPIPTCMLEPCQKMTHALSSVFESPERLRKVIKTLCDYGVARRSGTSLCLHPHISKSILAMPDYQKNWPETIVGIMSEKLSPRLPPSVLEIRRREIYPHATQFALDLVRKRKFSDMAVVLINNVANQARSLQNLSLATELMSGLMNYYTTTVKKENEVVSSLAVNMGMIYKIQGNTGEALAMFEKARLIDQRIYGENHENVADDLAHIAQVHEQMKRYQEASSGYEKALSIFQTKFGDKNIKVVRVMTNYVSVLKALGDKQRAYEMAKKIVDIESALFGANAPKLMVSLATLGLIASEINKPGEAISALERVLELEKKMYGVDHPKVAVRMSHLGNLHERAGEKEVAGRYYRQALAVLTDTLGAEHNSTKLIESCLRRVQ